MRIFVAGATGAVGRPLIPKLLAAGHEVVGMTRREEKAAEMRAAGAEAVVCDVFDAEGSTEVVEAARPDVVVHALTALPKRYGVRDDWLAATNRVRTEGTRNLVAAAQAAGAKRMVAESVCFFYRPEGDWVKDEDAPALDPAPGKLGAGAAALAELERRVLEGDGIEGLVLRFGRFYGPGTEFAEGGQPFHDVRRRRLPIVGPGTGILSFVHVEDAAAAVVAAVAGGAPGIYNVVDDEPAPMHEWLPAYARSIGAKPPRRVPVWLARLVVGRAAYSAVTMRGASNAKAKRELGWQPAHPSWRQGFGAP